MSLPQISIVIPLYNEAKAFPFLIERLNKVTEKINASVEIVLVDDGSKDETSLLMYDIAMHDEKYHCVFLSRNFGHQVAVSAGLKFINATEGAMVIDADLQDPPEMLETFYENFKKGYEVSYGVRTIRDDEGFFKKTTSSYFYKILRGLSNIDIPQNSGDFCFMSRRVINILNSMPEEHRFIRGMRAWVGFKQVAITYDRDSRIAGTTKYTLKKMFGLAYNGIFNFSELPIKFITRLGAIAISIALVYLGYTLYKKIVYHNVAEGFSGLLFALILFSGVQLVSIGILGEYIVRIFFQTKERPLYIISKRVQNKNEIIHAN